MPRPKLPDAERTIPVSARLKTTGVARADAIAAEHYAGNRTRALARLLVLGLQAWDRGAR